LSELVFGVALFEDLAAVIILAVLTAIATGAGLSAKMIAVTVGQLAFFLGALVGVGLFIVPRAIRLATRFERDETVIVASVGICFAVAMIADWAGYSVALGAFLAGVLVSESGHTHKIEHLIAPLRDIFGAVFFVSVGMMLDPQVLVDHWPELIALVGVVMVGKIIGVAVGATLTGSSTRMAVQAGMAMSQIGEFSFIIVGAGLEHHATHDFLYSLAIAVSAITTFSTPFMIRASGRVGSYIDARLPHSVSMLQSIYDAWIERMRARARPTRIRGAVALVGVAIAAVIAIALAYELTADRLETMLAAATGVSADTADILVQAMALAVTALPGLAIWRAAHRIAIRVAEGISHPTSRPDGVTETDLAATSLLAGIFETAIVFGSATFLLAVIAPLMSLFDGLAGMVVVVSGLAIAVWRISRHLHALMHSTSRVVVERLLRLRESSPAAATEVADAAGLGPLFWVRVPDGSPALGRSLANLDLHASTGAMVMAIARDGHGITLPGREEILRAGDTLALAGSSEAVDAARSLLAAPAVESIDVVATPN
jgi:CPA2 family monovalent cation:H+ antiporter-2